MHNTKHLDWLSCTFSQLINPSYIFPLMDWHYIGRGQHGYRAKYISRNTGAEFQTDSADQAMGSHLQFSGSVLENARRELGATDDGLARKLVQLGAKSSRIDLTINVHGGQITPSTMRDELKQGTCKALATSYRFIEGKNGNIEGDTLYIGSPASDRQFRCYNKAAEIGVVDGEAWVRFELELRRVVANGAFQSCGTNGVSETVSGHMGHFINWDNAEFNSALGNKGVEPADIPRKATNRQRWLLGQVAQALAKEIDLDVEFKALFDLAVGSELDKIKSDR
jgi:hypothetical protein